ncbi:hypothetical protein [Methylomonas sp. 11b]|uniref:hypothetical protein n=1 Tax=Methylomonas sp. 11b TaxID=1168169 RepID=UPI0012DF7D5A|nr:hypothetical protein [Methylomonas sp. 11b]
MILKISHALSCIAYSKEHAGIFPSDMNESKADCEIIGPFPLLHVIYEKILNNASPKLATVQFGWRMLVMLDDQPVALIDCDIKKGATRPPFIHSGDAALSLHDALAYLQVLGKKRKWIAGLHQIKIIDLPDCAKSCLWISHTAKGFLSFSNATANENVMALQTWSEFVASAYPVHP